MDMPYPRNFVPSTTVTIDDARGHVVAGLSCQLFKPLLGYSTNGPQPLIIDAVVPNMAGIILRGLVRVPLSSPLVVNPGPSFWSLGLDPKMILSEDSNNVSWTWLDAIPWNYLLSDRLWSFFAFASHAVSPPPPPPPPT